MKSIVIYTSKTGFTQRYAKCLSDRLNSTIITLDEAKKMGDDFLDEYDAIIYGGWAKAGSIVGSKYLIQEIDKLKGKKIAIFMVGASPSNYDYIEVAIDNILNDEQKKYAKVFYCQGGLNYEKMSTLSKIGMKIFARLVKIKDAQIGQALSNSYDIYDEKYLEPIIDYIKED